MPADEILEEAVEFALTELIDAIYQRCEALSHNVSVEEYGRLDRRVAEAEESWKSARRCLLNARSAGVDRPGRPAKPAVPSPKRRSA